MENTSHNRIHTIAYIVPRTISKNAIPVNIIRRKRLLEKIGYKVNLIEHVDKQFYKTCVSLWKQRRQINKIIIRIDGSCALDKFTLLKFFLPNIPFIWEIHGFPEERLAFSQNLSAKWFVWKNNMKRALLSYIVDGCIFISSELQLYAKKKIYTRKTAIIPNFVQTSTADHSIQSHHVLSSILKKNNFHIVLWGGAADHPWQATDLIQKTAKRVYRRNKHIIFLLTGSNFWYPVKPSNNIVFLGPTSHDQFLKLISVAHVCLALYHKPKFFPFYFSPMKILDYMSMGKPVIASRLGSIPKLIQNAHNGFLTNNSAKDITKKILLTTRNIHLSQKLSYNARKTVTTYFNDTVAQKQYSDLFRSLENRGDKKDKNQMKSITLNRQKSLG